MRWLRTFELCQSPVLQSNRLPQPLHHVSPSPQRPHLGQPTAKAQSHPDQQPLHQCYFFGRQDVRGRQKINCLGLWRSKPILFGGGKVSKVNNSTGKLWLSRTPTNEFGCHGLAGDILRISSSDDVSTVYRLIQHRAAPRPAGCKGGSVVMSKRDKRTGTGLGLDTMVHHLRRIARSRASVTRRRTTQ
jgi:hypothetical protein